MLLERGHDCTEKEEAQEKERGDYNPGSISKHCLGMGRLHARGLADPVPGRPTRSPVLEIAKPLDSGWVCPLLRASARASLSSDSLGAQLFPVLSQKKNKQPPRRRSNKCAINRGLCANCVPQAMHTAATLA